MKKIFALLLVLAMVLSFAACNKQPAVESSSDEAVTTSEETVTTSEETVTTSEQTATTTSNKPTTTTTTSKKPVSTTTTSKQPDPATTTSKKPVSTFSGTYADDTTIAALSYTYDSLKAELEAYVAANPSASGTVDLSSDFKKYSVLGYYVDGATMEAKVTLDANRKVTKFVCKITAPYKEKTFIEEALKRDVDKIKQFGGKDPMIYISMQYGNPANYPSLADMDKSRADKIYSGASSEFFNIKSDDSTTPPAQLSIKTTRDAQYNKSFTAEFTVVY